MFYSIATGVLPGLTYQFKITATNGRGTSLQSPVGAALAASAPAQPAAPTLLSQDSTQITITWVAPDSRGLPIVNFEVNWDAGLGGQPRTVISTVGNNVFYASTSLQPQTLIGGANYIFAIRAINSLGFSPYGSSATFMAAAVPAQPGTPTVSSASSASISIQWTQPANGGTPITNYFVYVAVGPTVSDGSFQF